MLQYIVETCTAAGKIAGGFTRGGDPSSLLSHGFAMVGLSHDLLDASVGAQSIMTGGMAFGGAFVKTAPGLTQLKKWSRNKSKLVPTAGYVCSTVIPTVIWHLWSVKGWGASPNLALPKVMPADVSGTVDMEKVEPGPNPTPYWIAMVEGVVRMLFPNRLCPDRGRDWPEHRCDRCGSLRHSAARGHTHCILAMRRHGGRCCVSEHPQRLNSNCHGCACFR